MSDFRCPRGYDPCKQIGCDCRAQYKRLMAKPGLAKKVLDELKRFAFDPDPDDMIAVEYQEKPIEEVEAELRAAGIDIDELNGKTNALLRSLQTNLNLQAKLDRVTELVEKWELYDLQGCGPPEVCIKELRQALKGESA